MDIDRETNEDNSRRIQVRFVTKLKAPYKVPTTAIAIPSHLSRLGLSSIVNKLLQAGKKLFSFLYPYKSLLGVFFLLILDCSFQVS